MPLLKKAGSTNTPRFLDYLVTWQSEFARVPPRAPEPLNTGTLGTRLDQHPVSFSYPEPFLRAVRRGALAKSKTGNHKNMVKDIYVIRTITFVVANQMPV